MGIYRPCCFISCHAGWLVGGCGVRTVSRKTPTYFKMIYIIFLVIIIIRFLFKMPRIVPDQYFIIAIFSSPPFISINIIIRNIIKIIINIISNISIFIRLLFKLPRIVPDQREKFDCEDIFKKHSREAEVGFLKKCYVKCIEMHVFSSRIINKRTK